MSSGLEADLVKRVFTARIFGGCNSKNLAVLFFVGVAQHQHDMLIRALVEVCLTSHGLKVSILCGCCPRSRCPLVHTKVRLSRALYSNRGWRETLFEPVWRGKLFQMKVFWRCDRFRQMFVQIGAILAILWPFEIFDAF